jgi:phosphatidylserine decarboxylase
MIVSGLFAAWREIRAVVLGLVGLTLLSLARPRWRWLAGLSALLLGWVVYFFRDPARIPGDSSPDTILAPADGRITQIELVDEPHFVKGPARRISIFLSLFDVHVQRTPCQGTVRLLRYQSGSFAPAFLKDIHDNESNLIGLQTPHGPVAVKQIAGILARRIVCWVDLYDEVAVGQRLGLIKFGSRVDLLLPPDVDLSVEVGQQLYGGQTVVGRFVPK